MTCHYFSQHDTPREICFNTQQKGFAEIKSQIEELLPASGFKCAYETISSWPKYSPTPLLSLTNLANTIGVKSVLYKNEAERFGLKSFKALGGAYAVYKCLENLIEEDPSNPQKIEAIQKKISNITVTSATDGNHGKSVAWGARMFGCKCIIFIHEKVSKNREIALKEYGAQVVRSGKNYDESVKIANQSAQENGWYVISDTSYAGYTEIPKHVMNGYELMAYEAVVKQNAKPTHVFLQTGVGSLAAGVTANLFRNLNYAPKIIIVDPEDADCWTKSIKNKKPVNCEGDLNTLMAGLACGTVSILAWELLSKTIDAAMSISDIDAARAIRCLKFCKKSEQSIEAGESATAGLAGLILLSNNSSLKDRLTINKNSEILIFGSEGVTDPDIYNKIINNDLLADQ